MRTIILFLALGCGIEGFAAQLSLAQPAPYDVRYRPAEARYLIGRYPHFDLIYEEGTEATAFRIGAALEAHRAVTDSLVGRTGAPLRMPVVVNGYNDRANGFVNPLPFRQEIEAPSIKSDALTTAFSSWPAAVAPHELVHAAHADLNAGFGVGGLARLMGPDWSRVINLTAPRGLVEGVAVYQESQLEPRAGRLHAPLATMAYRAAMLSDDPWSLTQMLEAPSYTRPFDRHYLGGGQAIAYLAGRDDPEGGTSMRFFQRATRLHHRLPFLGFGVALWHGTSTWPATLGATMQRDLIEREQLRHDARRPFTTPTLIDGAPGRVYRRPHWVDDSTLVVHAQGYALRPGFYAVAAHTGRRTLLSAQTITEDVSASLSRDSSALYFSRYVPDRLVPRQWRAEAQRLELESGSVRPVTRGGRVHAPVEAPGRTLWALQNDGAFNQWSAVQPDGTVRPLTAFEGVRFEQVAPSPSGDTVAALLNVDGRQRLYRAAPGADGSPQLTPWLGFEHAAIYDVSWGPDGRYLLFAADPDSVANVYAFDTQRGDVRQLTNVPFGALEPALSPDGQTLAFVNYRHERFDLVRMPFRPSVAPRLGEEALLHAGDAAWPSLEVSPSNASSSREPAVHEPAVHEPKAVEPYRSVRHLAPRVAYPTVQYDIDDRGGPLGLKAGLGVAGADPLQQWAYTGEAFYRAHRLWGEAHVRSGHTVLRPSFSLYNRPYVAGGAGADAEAGVEERGATLRLGAPVTFTSNVFLTRAQFQLGSALRQTRLIDAGGEAQSDFRTRWTLQPAAAFGYRVQANLRDLIPNHGVTLNSRAEIDAWTSGGTASRGWLSTLRAYLPFLRATNTGVMTYARLLTQSRGSIFNAEAMVPRGYAGSTFGAGGYGQVGAEVVQPVAFIDDGFTLLPLYVKALYAYGFAETTRALTRLAYGRSTAGGGLGVRVRVFYALDLDLRIGAAYRFASRDVRVIFR